MAAYTGGKFRLPSNFNSEWFVNGEEKVCVVAVIGKSRYNLHHAKGSMINPLVDTDIFGGFDHNSNEELCYIEGYFDSVSRVIYLHLISAYDTVTLVDMCEKAAAEIDKEGYHQAWQTAEFMHAKAVLFLFHISHMVLLVHPNCSFDISYVRFFRILDSIRVKLQPVLAEVLHGVSGVSKEWMSAGRPCSPRVLFVFESSTIDYGMDNDTIVMSKTRSQKTPPIKRLQHAIEDQIYRILRKSRIITNISNNSLFAVPANQEFVYVHSKRSLSQDPINFYLAQLKNNCTTTKDADVPRSRSYQTNRRTNQSGPSSEPSRPLTSMVKTTNENSFKEFLWQHVDLALTKGFDDNVGKNPVPAIFELPSSEVWFDVSSRLYNLFLVEQSSPARAHFNTLKSLLELDIRFSEGRCGKVLPIAESAYQENLPPHYTKSFHLNKLVQAKRVFAQHARGAATEKYISQLEEDCEKIWKNGRQLCEEISLTGNHCVNELHRLPDQVEAEDNKHLPEMNHFSQVKTKATCDCGRKQAEREDPFDHKAANYDFYQKLEQSCCVKLEHIELPVFTPGSAEVKPHPILSTNTSTTEPAAQKTVELSRVDSRRDSARLDSVVTGMSNLSLALSLGQSGGSDVYGPQIQASLAENEATQDAVTMETEQQPSAASERHLKREHSTTEYLMGMVHSQSPPGLLPKFSSWSLLSLGRYSSYSPLQGLDQPGFLHGSNHLLPWDISVKVPDKDKWPSVTEMNSKKGKSKKGQKDIERDQHLRLYVGIEYECPRGHRFFCSGPDKMVKAPPSGAVKETSAKLLTSDMPLYFPCHCRSSKGFMAQLMRVFFALPDGPIDGLFNPRVQPAPAPCPVFHTGSDGPLRVAAGNVWVLRLPYVYLGDSGPYLMPSESQHMSACRLLKGFFGYDDLTQVK